MHDAILFIPQQHSRGAFNMHSSVYVTRVRIEVIKN